MGTKLPRKLDWKIQTVGEQIRLADCVYRQGGCY